MSAAAAAAAAYLACRQRVQDCQDALNTARAAFHLRETGLLNAIMEAGEGEDAGTSIVHAGLCLQLKEEYWEQPAGEWFNLHKLVVLP